MVDLTELQRLAEGASDEAEGDWFCADLLEPGAPDISASTKARAFMHAFDPDTAKKLIAVALKAAAVVRRWDTPLWKDVPATADYINELRAALEELKK